MYSIDSYLPIPQVAACGLQHFILSKWRATAHRRRCKPGDVDDTIDDTRAVNQFFCPFVYPAHSMLLRGQTGGNNQMLWSIYGQFVTSAHSQYHQLSNTV